MKVCEPVFKERIQQRSIFINGLHIENDKTDFNFNLNKLFVFVVKFLSNKDDLSATLL